MCSSLLQLAVESRDLSQDEKKIEAEQIHQITTLFTQNDVFFSPLDILTEKSCHFDNLLSL